ncbi:hypothetical protein N7456_010407 [Penicillium angulare]|uniref:GPI inositol-deacylase n=1 Tax=Penicillium angulare TaxID=116970 RepID=A0A9W9K6P7_9EURO|nr:hypothetical protein N7456_010407 [Penicillium angulare]
MGPMGIVTLNDPPPTSALVDIVFIHGLGGGSVKTWTASNDPNLFWPKTWLPNDDAFENVRFHTFGYKADWAKRQQSIMNIHDFARSLIAGLRNDPLIRRDNSRILLVGHSMGGCVAKEAYLIARQNPSFKVLSERIYGMFFLGTPHTGSDMVKLIETFLVVALGKEKPFVKDLKNNSTVICSTNYRFRQVAMDLSLWTFYETLPVKVGMFSKLIVPKEVAILGYDEERVEAMNADHRNLCRFTSRNNSNYKLLRNALHTAIDEIKQEFFGSEFSSFTLDSTIHSTDDLTPNGAMSQLASFLKVDGAFDSSLMRCDELKEPGTCDWFIKKRSFKLWVSGIFPVILWLTGRPAAGKTILSSHVISHLSMSACCSYFFFEHSSSSLGDCFRSLAYQMAMQDSIVRDKVLQLARGQVTWDIKNEGDLWNKLFLEGILKLPLKRDHFWVIDGLDECSNFSHIFTRRLLARFPQNGRVRMLVTSRSLDSIERGIKSLGTQVSLESVSNTDTFEDIRLFLTTRLTELDRLENDDSREAICRKILKRSSGSFLWVRLILKEFENVWSAEDMDRVLVEVPEGLNDLYLKMLNSIETNKSLVPLAKSILTWVTTACRPLKLDELRCAVKLDLNKTLQNSAKAVPSICGQFVFIDQSDHVHIIHETAREFLRAKHECSGFNFEEEQSHTHIGSSLLRYLSTVPIKPDNQIPLARGNLPMIASRTNSHDTSLIDYACKFFSEHIHSCTPSEDELMGKISHFLKNSVLLWIEYTATCSDLSNITKTGTNLRRYLERRERYVPPDDPSFQVIKDWVIDLIRIAAKFRTQLLARPSSIHALIPPLCPPDSIISRSFAKSSYLSVKGLETGTWDDCLARIDFAHYQATAVCHSEKHFAVAFSTGKILLYDASSLRLSVTLLHFERVKSLEFSYGGQYLAACGSRNVVLWELKSRKKMFSFPLRAKALGISFLGENELICALSSNEIIKWTLDSDEQHSMSWKLDDNCNYTRFAISNQAPTRVAFLIAAGDVLIAIGYRQNPVLLWNASDLRLQGQCQVKANNGIDDMLFNPNPEITILVVSFNDGRLCLIDYTTMLLVFTLQDQCACCFACSPDGHSLATGTIDGIIEIFSFDYRHDGNPVLTSIYRVETDYEPIRGLAFSSDGVRFVDIRDKSCHIWVPTVLVGTNNELRSISDATTQVQVSNNLENVDGRIKVSRTIRGVFDNPEEPEITSALVTSADGEIIIAGQSGGTVALFSSADGSELGRIKQHTAGVSVVAVEYVESLNMIISADDAWRVVVGELPTSPSYLAHSSRQPWQNITLKSIVINRRFGGAVESFLINHTADRLLVSGRNLIELWNLSTGNVIAWNDPLLLNSITTLPKRSADNMSYGKDEDGSLARSAFQHPSNPEWFVVVAEDTARVFKWVDFEDLTAPYGITLERPSTPSETSQTSQGASSFQSPKTARSFVMSTYHTKPGMVIELFRSISSAVARLYKWPAAAFDPYAPRVSALPSFDANLKAIGPNILSVLGIIGTYLVYIDVDFWVCSTALQSTMTSKGIAMQDSWQLSSQPAIRHHFFALGEWRTAGDEIQCGLVNSRAPSHQRSGPHVAFVNGHRLVVIKDGLNF